MKICRFDGDRVGIVSEPAVFDVTSMLEERYRRPAYALSTAIVVESLPWLESGAWRGDALERRLADVRLEAPVPDPGKIIGAPANYRAHVREMQAAGIVFNPDIREAGLFLKANSSLSGPSSGIALRFPHRRTDYEVELVAVIGKTVSDIVPSVALDAVIGYSLGLDITLRGPEDRSFRKSIDSYSVVGPWLATCDQTTDPQNLWLTLRQNGELRQRACTSDMVLSVAELVAFASQFFTLHPGDLLFTGTPKGVGALFAGDVLDAGCDAIGSMKVTVRSA